MRISTKSRHAITAMLELTLQDRPMKLSMISDNNAISLSYLEQIFASLRLKGLVKGQRGPGGGYVLGKQAAEISIAEIISAVDEWVEYAFSKPKMVVTASHALTTQTLWNDLSHQIYDFLDATSLADIVANASAYQGLMDEAA
ncbi:MAG: Rrf2 family transcriptional regulator [Gammaproteobacteria bacterium]|nr:Rrf2 family transcriptional regulator [Gammaproteobacteria bacterium]